MRAALVMSGVLSLIALVACGSGPSQSRAGTTQSAVPPPSQSAIPPASSAPQDSPSAWVLDFKDGQGYAFHTTWSVEPDGAWPPVPDIANAPPGEVRISFQYAGIFTYRNDTSGRNAPGESVQMPRATGYYKTTRPICSQFFEPGPYVLTVEGYPGTYCVETIAEGDGGPIDSLPPDTSGTISLIGVNFDKVVPEASAPALLQDIESGPDLIAVDTKVKYSGTKACDAAGNLGDAIYSPQSSERTINFICTDLKPASR